MEARTNEPAYTALKRLDKEGLLKFELLCVLFTLVCVNNSQGYRSVVEELTKARDLSTRPMMI